MPEESKHTNFFFRAWNLVKVSWRNGTSWFISTGNIFLQILGALFSTWCSLVCAIFVGVLWLTNSVYESCAADIKDAEAAALEAAKEAALKVAEEATKPIDVATWEYVFYYSWELIIPTLAFIEVICIVRKLMPIFSLRKQELSITWSQICILLGFLAWLVSVLIITGLDRQNDFLTIAIGGCVLSWVFQDYVKNIVAFLYLRMSNLLHIGDWVIVPSRSIDGIIKSVNMSSVTVENWDTTKTSFPVYILYTEPFKNLQSMLDRKTHGRRMFMSFILDSEWIQPLTMEEAERIAEKIETDTHFIDTQILGMVRDAFANNKEVLNIALFRRYVHHWLMRNPKFSRIPRLIVRYLEPTEYGVPMQIYGYIVDVSLESFEWVQSDTMEHLLHIMSYFNLKLYQSPSGFDASNTNIFLAPNCKPYKNNL